MRNATVEGVAARVRVESGDMRKLPFANASFDAVVSSLAVHNIPDREGRRTAMREIARVLKAGGSVAIMDIANVADYVADLREAGVNASGAGLSPWIFPPTRILRGTKL